MFRPRGDLCWLQRPLFPLAVGVRPQRQPRGVQPAVPPDLRPDRRPGRTYIAGKHLLSVRDLNLSAHIGELLDAGVTSFKIEGRLKDVGYIKNIVAYYRREVDAALAVRPHLRRASAGESIPDFTPDTAKSFHARGVGIFLRGQAAGRGVVRYAEGGGRVCGPCGAGRKEQVPSRSGRFARPRATASVSSPTGGSQAPMSTPPTATV